MLAGVSTGSPILSPSSFISVRAPTHVTAPQTPSLWHFSSFVLRFKWSERRSILRKYDYGEMRGYRGMKLQRERVVTLKQEVRERDRDRQTV